MLRSLKLSLFPEQMIFLAIAHQCRKSSPIVIPFHLEISTYAGLSLDRGSIPGSSVADPVL